MQQPKIQTKGQKEQQNPQMGRQPRLLSLGIKLRNFQDFRKQWKHINYPSNLAQQEEMKIYEFWDERLKQLLTDKQRHCYSLSDKFPLKGIEVCKMVIRQLYEDRVGYEYESYFLGNKKQLMVYKKSRQFESYLSQYTLPKQYKNISKVLQQYSMQYNELIKRRNANISLNNEQQIIEYSKKIQELNIELNKILMQYQQLLLKILGHFKQIQNRQRIILVKLARIVGQRIKIICQKMGLFVCDRFIDCDKMQWKDYQITKRQQLFQDFNDQIIEEPLAEFDEFITPVFVQQRPMELPKTLNYCKFIKINQDLSLVYKIQLPNTSIYNKIQYILIKCIQTQYIKRIQVIQQQYEYQIIIPAQHQGYTTYHITTQNKMGINERYQQIYVKHQIDQFHNKIQNKKILFIGGNQNYIVPFKDNFGKKETTCRQIYTCNLQCIDISLGMQGIICNNKGMVANWGNMAIWHTKQQIEQCQDFIQQIDNMTMSIQSPCRISQLEYICKIKTASGLICIIQVLYYIGFCLALNVFGRVYSWGTNDYGQLGYGHCDNVMDNITPKMIPSLYYIVDIQVSRKCGCMALDRRGMVYRWGYDQSDSARLPVRNRFGDIINFTRFGDIAVKQLDPVPINPKLINDKIKKIVCSNQVYFILCQNGQLYGWGLVDNLGIGQLQDNNKKIQYIYNPIRIGQQIQQIKCGYDHYMIRYKNNIIKGWGNMKSFGLQQYTNIPKQLQFNYNYNIQCAYQFTILWNNNNIFIKTSYDYIMKSFYQQYTIYHHISKIFWEFNTIVLLTQQKIIIQ